MLWHTYVQIHVTRDDYNTMTYWKAVFRQVDTPSAK